MKQIFLTVSFHGRVLNWSLKTQRSAGKFILLRIFCVKFHSFQMLSIMLKGELNTSSSDFLEKNLQVRMSQIY